MADMNIQERYSEISQFSGVSEEVVRRVLKACRKSLAASLKRGERATLPGICTMLPEVKNKIELGGTVMTSYIKVKAKASNSMESELEKLSQFDKNEDKNDDSALSKLNFINTDGSEKNKGIRTAQINALL